MCGDARALDVKIGATLVVKIYTAEAVATTAEQRTNTAAVINVALGVGRATKHLEVRGTQSFLAAGQLSDQGPVSYGYVS